MHADEFISQKKCEVISGILNLSDDTFERAAGRVCTRINADEFVPQKSVKCFLSNMKDAKIRVSLLKN